MTLSEALRDTIRALMQERRWSQRDLARHLGVTQGQISYLLAEKRRVGELEYYAQLAGIFGLSLSAFMARLEQRVAATSDLATQLTEARRTIHLLCELIDQHSDPALAELVPDILDPRERS